MVAVGASNGSFSGGTPRSSLMIEDRVGGQHPGGSTNAMVSEALAPRLLMIAQGAAEAAAAAATASSPASTQQQVMEPNGTRCGEEILGYGRAEKVLIGGVLTMLTLSTICGNLLVVISVCFVKKLRQPSNYLIVSLAVADLSVALAVMPFVSITDLIGGQWVFGQFFCNVFIAMDVMCCTASIMTLCVISIDRYLGITNPLTYPVRQNGCCMAKMILSVWLLSASITLPPLFGWAQNVNDGRVCLISQDFGYTVYSTAVAFYIPMSVMLIMYYRIYRAAKLSAAKHTITGFPRQGEHGAPAAPRGGEGGRAVPQSTVSEETRRVEGEVEEESLDCVAAALKLQREVEEECSTRVSRLLKTGEYHQRRQRKNQSIFKREQKAAATLGIVVGAFTFCWLPFFLVSTARPFVCGVECSCVPLWLREPKAGSRERRLNLPERRSAPAVCSSHFPLPWRPQAGVELLRSLTDHSSLRLPPSVFPSSDPFLTQDRHHIWKVSECPREDVPQATACPTAPVCIAFAFVPLSLSSFIHGVKQPC